MTSQPSIVKYSQSRPVGIETVELSRHCIGYVVRGRKRIYYGDMCYEVAPGELYYLPTGHHSLEDIPEGGKPAEQIVCWLSATEISATISRLLTAYRMELPPRGVVDDTMPHIVVAADEALARYFNALTDYLTHPEPVIEQMRLQELVYLLLSRPNSPVGARLRTVTSYSKSDFEQIVRSHILTDISLADLSVKCGRSFSAFKNDFRTLFREPPHRWFTRQRLLHACMTLRSTDLPIARVATECHFSTPSHFIKQFKKEYGITPAQYRRAKQ